MKNLKFILSCLLLLGGVAAVGASVAPSNEVTRVEAAETQVVSCSCPAGTVSNNSMTFNVDPFTIVHKKANGTSFASYSPWRVYGYNTVEFTASNESLFITQIKITCGSESYAKIAFSVDAGPLNGTTKSGNESISGKFKTITFSEGDKVGYVKLTSSVNSQSRWSKIDISYVVDSGAVYHTTSFYANDGTTDPYYTTTTEEGKSVAFPEDPTRKGYEFAGWYDASENGNPVNSLIATESSSLYAYWTPVTYDVSFETDSTNIHYAGDELTTDENGVVILPDVTCDDKYSFGGWYNGDTFVGWPGDEFLPSSDVILTGKTIDTDMYIVFDDNGVESSTPIEDLTSLSNQIIKGNDLISSYVGTRVYAGDTGLKLGGSSDVGSMTLTLNSTYFVSKIVISAKCRTLNSVDSATMIVDDNSAVTLTDSYADYEFNYAKDINSFTIAGGTASKGRFNIKSISIYYSDSTAAMYKTNFDANGGTINGSDVKVVETVEGNEVSFPVPTYEGHEFLGWYDAAEGGNKVESLVASAETDGTTLYAHWIEVKTLSITPENFATLEAIEISGVEENTSYSNEFNVIVGGYITSSYIKGISTIVVDIYGNYNNLAVYANTSAEGEEITPTKTALTNGNSGYSYAYDLDGADSFYLVNTSTSYTSNLYNIDINYTGSIELPANPVADLEAIQTKPSVGFSFTKAGEEYTFSNVRLSFRATVDAELFAQLNVTAAGFEATIAEDGAETKVIDCSEKIGTDANGDSYIFGSILVPEGKENIEVTAKAYFVVDGAKVYLKETTRSLVSAVSAYLDGAVELTEEQLAAVTALAATLGIEA